MYNRYQNHQDFSAVEPDPRPAPPPSRGQAPGDGEPGRTEGPAASPLLGQAAGALSRLLGEVAGRFSLKSLDAGDILLVLIILFLYLEGDDLELVITLGLMLLLGLGED